MKMPTFCQNCGKDIPGGWLHWLCKECSLDEEARFHAKREQRTEKIWKDWLSDHPGKTMADAKIAGTCVDPDEAAWIEWCFQRYKGRDPLDCP
jgi:hypothetical protein